MSKQRLQVLFEEDEIEEIRQVAQARRLTVAEWVRQTLRRARREEPDKSPKAKLEIVRTASRYQFPTADVDQMLSEIDRGYRMDDGGVDE